MKLPILADNGNQVEVTITEAQLKDIARSNNPPAALNKMVADTYKVVPTEFGSAFQQMKANLGLTAAFNTAEAYTSQKNPFALAPLPMGKLLSGQGTDNLFSANIGNNQNYTAPIGSEARTFIALAIVDEVMASISVDRSGDEVCFDEMVAATENVAGNVYVQPVVDYRRNGGPETAEGTRVVEGAKPTSMLFFTTNERIKTVPAWTIGMDYSDQALRNVTVDKVTRTLDHYFRQERGNRVYSYLEALFNGDNDMNAGAVPAVTAQSLDSSITTAGKLTHDALVMFLARKRRQRKITHLIMTDKTRLAFDKREGRPGTNAYDPSLLRVDPQGQIMNPQGMDHTVRIYSVESLADGGLMPDNQIWALSQPLAIQKVIDTTASYRGVEEYAMSRSTQMRFDWAEMVVRYLGNTDGLIAFDRLHLTV